MERLLFLDLVRDELEQVETLLLERLPEQHPTIGMAVDHLIGGGGKRLRPALVLLSAHLCGADVGRALFAAAGVEMLHTATLVHDDLIDGSLMRRGIQTLNARWTPGATVLTGDYVFARAAFLVARTENVELVRRFAETLMIICNGEIYQMFDGRYGQATRQGYEQRIHAKTASMLGLSAEAGAILAGSPPASAQALRDYGERLGLAFQIVDDVLDFVADEKTLGKPVGSDLRQGLITLPALLLLEEQPDHPDLLQALRCPSDETVRQAVQAVIKAGAVERAIDVAGDYAAQAKALLAPFTDNVYRTALLELADFTVCRRF